MATEGAAWPLHCEPSEKSHFDVCLKSRAISFLYFLFLLISFLCTLAFKY